MKTTLHLTLLSSALFLFACDAKETCVGDCDPATEEPSATETSADASTTEPSSMSGGDAEACAEAQADAVAFVESRQGCEFDRDCEVLFAACHPEELCGHVSVASDFDAAAWQPIGDALGASCTCDIAECGPGAFCIEGSCNTALSLQASECDRRLELAEAFIADNRACTLDSDCQGVPAGCYEGSAASCGLIALQNDADLDIWDALTNQLSVCNFDCAHDGCAPEIACVSGSCTSTF